MNHDPASSSAANLPPTRDDSQNTGAEGSHENDTQAASSRTRSQTLSRKKKALMARKLRLVTDLMSSLDMVIFAELCILYYMDCSFLPLFMRAIAQSLFLSPKSEEVLHMPAYRPHVYAVFVPNAICILLHIFSSLPQASEAARGYLHGGVMVDFIGQKAPTSKFSLLFLDVGILAIQCFMLAVHRERDRLRRAGQPIQRRRPDNSGSTNDDDPATWTAPTVQDHDAEERGVFRDGPGPADETNDIEMQPLGNRRGRGQEADEDSRLGREVSWQGHAITDPADALRSGNVILADFHVVETIRSLGNDRQSVQSAAAHSLQTLGYAAALARMATEQRTMEARNRPQ